MHKQKRLRLQQDFINLAQKCKDMINKDNELDVGLIWAESLREDLNLNIKKSK